MRALDVGEIIVVRPCVVNEREVAFLSKLWDVKGAQIASDSARVPRERHLKTRTVTSEERAGGDVVLESDCVSDLVVSERAGWAGK